jgi:hypothetical protein
MNGKGKYRRYICVGCIALSGGYFSLEERDAVDVIEKATFLNKPRPAASLISPARECPAWFTGNQPAMIGPDPSPLLLHIDTPATVSIDVVTGLNVTLSDMPPSRLG